MNNLGEQYTPTLMQKAIGEPLRSEQRTGDFLPRVLSRADIFVIFIAIILFIPNASVVQSTQETANAPQGAGYITYLYWVIGTVTFLIPGAIVTAQLNGFMPSNGGIYVWTHRALGPLWGFFAGFCAWFPGILVLLAAGDAITSLIQGIGVQIFGSQNTWLVEPWQQGIVALCVLLLGGWLATLPLQLITKLAKGVIALYGLGIFLVGLAGIAWLVRGHAAWIPFPKDLSSFTRPQFVLYGVIILALLGIEVPLNMAAEAKEKNSTTFFLRWGPLIVMLAYIIGSFGVMVVVPPEQVGMTYSTLTAIKIVFGTPMAVIVGLIFIGFFLIVTVMYNLAFARLLFVSALDQRLPARLAQVNRHHAPLTAIKLQTVLVIGIALFTYFLGPLLYSGQKADFASDVYNVSQASTTVIWCFSMVFLFLDLPILLQRFRDLLKKKRALLIAPPWLLHLCSAVGVGASLLGIWTTLSLSWDTAHIPNYQWTLLVGGSAFACLVVGLLGSAYPRLLSSLNEQTAIARENARLYDELRLAYAKLRELDHLKDAFLTTASHELRTPLTIVQGYLELLGEMDDIEPKVRREFLNKARRACDELVLLQANIMDASRITFDTAAIHCKDTSLRGVCSTVVDLFEPLILQQQQPINLDIDANIQVWADETRLKQILHNLFANALRYSPPYSPIDIAAKEDRAGCLACISVVDRGLGVPPDKHEIIFERFVRLERDLHGSVRGSGLGLAITRQLVEAMHGTISVESSGVSGEGSTFIFTLPLTPVTQ